MAYIEWVDLENLASDDDLIEEEGDESSED